MPIIPVTHHQGDPEKIEKTTKINIFHTKMLAYYLDKLRATPDGDGSLLDHSMILYGAAPERRQSAPLHRSAASARRRRREGDQGRTACPLSAAARR